jgi:rhamnose utilization protein RhaD (predicted bifunctional aldolase and dehydrogenase)
LIDGEKACTVDSTVLELTRLGREIGREDRGLVVLSEGSVSAKLDEHRYLVKASGAHLANLGPEQLVEVRGANIQNLFEQSFLDSKEFEKELMDCRIDPAAPKPSTELLFHHWLLSLEGIRFVAHSHPVSVNQILCSPQGETFAQQRMLPDEILACGTVSVFVPYSDPGVPLAREIRARVSLYQRRSFGRVPKVILLQNHGVITLGETADAALRAMLMVEKAARVFIGAALLGGPVFMQQHQVQRVERPTEDGRRGPVRSGP